MAVETPTAAFDADVGRVVLQLRAALTGVFAGLSRPIRGGTDLQRELGLPSTLSWQLHGFIDASDPVAAASQLPGRHAMGRALAAARAKGVDSELVRRATAAFDEFEACIERHTGSRAAFASMISSLGSGAPSPVDLKARRDAFRATSHIYGLQLFAFAKCFVLHPGSTPGRLDYAFVSVLWGLRVMRPFEKLFVGRHRCDPDRPAPEEAMPLPIVPATAASGMAPVLEEFCSKPLPEMSVEVMEGRLHEIYVSGPPVGKTGELTLVLAQHWPGAVPLDEEIRCNVTALHPAELLVHDVLLAPGITDRAVPPRTAVYGGALHELRQRYREVDRLNVRTVSSFAGIGVESLQTPAVPRYVEMLRLVCERLGWDADALEAYRSQVEYPVLHALHNVTFPAPGLRA